MIAEYVHETVERIMYCKNCGRKQEKGELFCTRCGTRYESAAQPEEPRPEKKTTYSSWVVFVIVFVICVTVGVLIFLFPGKDGAEIVQHHPTSTPACNSEGDTASASPVYSEDDTVAAVPECVEEAAASSLQDDILAELGSIAVEGETYILTLKDDYEAEACDDAEYRDDSTRIFEKGETLFDAQNRDFVLKVDGGYEYSERGVGEYFIPENYVHVRTYRWGILPTSILDKAILRFTAKDGNQLHLSKLKRNGHRLYDDENRKEVREDFYVMYGNIEGYDILGYEDDVCSWVCLEQTEGTNSRIDRNGNIYNDFNVLQLNSGCPVHFYIPSEKAFLYNGVLYYLSAIE